jgi:hypothetical protein
MPAFVEGKSYARERRSWPKPWIKLFRTIIVFAQTRFAVLPRPPTAGLEISASFNSVKITSAMDDAGPVLPLRCWLPDNSRLQKTLAATARQFSLILALPRWSRISATNDIIKKWSLAGGCAQGARRFATFTTSSERGPSGVGPSKVARGLLSRLEGMAFPSLARRLHCGHSSRKTLAAIDGNQWNKEAAIHLVLAGGRAQLLNHDARCGNFFRPRLHLPTDGSGRFVRIQGLVSDHTGEALRGSG